MIKYNAGMKPKNINNRFFQESFFVFNQTIKGYKNDNTKAK
jgi:hypothetical protein